MSASSESSAVVSDRIQKNEYVVVQKIGGEHMRVMRFTAKQKVLIEKLKFEADSTFGHRFGVFEITGGKATPVLAQDLMEQDGVGDLELRDLTSKPSEDITADDSDDPPTKKPRIDDVSGEQEVSEVEGSLSVEKELKPSQARQKLSQQEVLSMKNTTTASELVAKLVDGNKGFNDRTVYAQSKYIRRKTKKHSDRVLILKPTIRMLAQSYYLKDAERVANLRVDQLGLIMHMAGMRYGKIVGIFDQVLGLVTSAVLDRLGGNGMCVALHRGIIAQSIPCVHSMNYSEQLLEPLHHVRLEYALNDGKIPEVEESASTTEKEEGKMEEKQAEDVPNAGRDRRDERLRKEEVGFQAMKNGLDSIIIATRTVDPISALELLFPYLKPSGSVVVYGAHVGPLVDAHEWLLRRGALNVQLTDQMNRAQQVLPDRTHPLMSQHVVGGLLLSGIKVIVPSN